jgi:hypothetical protein
MDEHRSRYRGAFVLAALVLSAIAGIVAYNIGLSHGLAQSMAAQGTTIPPYAYGWYRPWGFGFGFPFLFVLLWFVVLRGLWWGGPRWRHRYYAGPYGAASAFDEWHRQAHERMKESPSADDPGRRG